MYIKKILLAVALLGVIIGGIIVYNIYTSIFSPNTAFNNDIAHVYIPTNATFDEVKEQLAPLLKNISTFETVAEKKEYISNVKAGKYAFKKEINNEYI